MLLNERDNTGCSPLHYASRGGHIRSLESLIRLGACVNIKNHCGESPLHFGARYGRYNIVKRLLNSEKGAFIINESDGEGLTPLHIASQQGKFNLFSILCLLGCTYIHTHVDICRSHKSSAIILKPRSFIAPRSQGSESPSFGRNERSHTDHWTTAFGSLAFTRPVRQRQKHRLTLGHYGEQTKCYNTVIVHEL